MDTKVDIHATVTHGGDGKTESIILHGPVIRIGRGPGNDIQFHDARVSSIHGRIFTEGSSILYEDLGSTNGSALMRRGKHLGISRQGSASVELEQGDEIRFGDAQRPSSIRLDRIVHPSFRQSDVTIIAKRALGQPEGLPPAEAFRKLLKLLADLRTEDDSFSSTKRVLDFCLQALPGSSNAACFMRKEDSFECVVAGSRGGLSTPERTPSSRLMERIISTGESLLVDDMSSAPSPSLSMQTMTDKSLILAPLMIGQKAVGALQVGSEDGCRFTPQDLDLLSVLAQQLSSVLDGSRKMQSLKETQDKLAGQCDYLKDRLARHEAIKEMIGDSPELRHVKQQIKAVAASKTTVLIMGETGSGKELVARALHETSPRANETFAAINCCALSPGLLESELFGHVKGAFTGAHRSRKGLFEVANGGTIFLDEIGDMPLSLQPKLLRVLEQGTIIPVGSSKEKKTDVRLVAATHRDLKKEVESGRFRQDLLFRLDVFQLKVPPLRDRAEDILPLANHFARLFAAEHAKKDISISTAAAVALQSYSWPGNVRELKNEMERATLLVPSGKEITREHLSDRVRGAKANPLLDQEGNLKEIMDRMEAMVLSRALQRHKGNRTRCAKELGISRQALIAKIQRLNVTEDS